MIKPFASPFLDNDFAKSFDVSRMCDMSKMFGEMKIPSMPSVNVDALVAAHRKNVEALASANQLGFEILQTLAKRQAEFIRQNIESASSVAQAIWAAPTPEEKVAKQTEATKASLERGVVNARELADLVTKNQCQALEVVSQRLAQGLDEWKDIIKGQSAAA